MVDLDTYMNTMGEFVTLEFELPRRMAYALKELSHRVFGYEETDALLVMMLVNCIREYNYSIPELAACRYNRISQDEKEKDGFN